MANEFWPVDFRPPGGENYGWGAILPMFIIRNIIGFHESDNPSQANLYNEEGYPGTLRINVVYLLTDENELIINYNAKTYKATHVNLTHHSYFNLSGKHQTNILNHELYISSESYLPIDESYIPFGQISEVSGTPFDFCISTLVGERINDEHSQLKKGNGYDHNWILNDEKEKMKLAAELFEAKSGRKLEVYTMAPGIQFYSGNYLYRNKTKGRFGFCAGLCLETQHFPNSPNQPAFPSTILRPGEIHRSQTIYRFLTK